MQTDSFKHIKLIATDIDGTLLNSRYELSPEFETLFRELRKRNIYVAAASGRQFHNLFRLFTSIADDLLFVAENGNYIQYKGEELLVRPLAPEAVLSLLKTGRNVPDSHVILCGKEGAYIDSDDPAFLNELQKYYAVFTRVENLETMVDKSILKVTLCDLRDAETNAYTYFTPYQDSFKVKVSGKIWLDVSAPGGDKGEAIKLLQSRFGITPDQTMVFGDYLNDLEMMQQATYSFAVANAHPELKAVARYTTFSNDEEGVLQILRRVILENPLL